MDPLSKVYFLRNLGKEAREEIVKRATQKIFKKGEVILKEGEAGESLFIIKRGSVLIYKKDKEGNDVFVDELKEGDFFGEFAFLTGKPRSATAVAEDECELLEITADSITEIEERYPEIMEVLTDFYKIRVLDGLLALSPLFSSLNAEERKFVLARFRLRIFREGEIIAREGEKGDSFFVIKDGVVGIYTKSPEGREVKLAELESGDFFGEVSVITGNPRTATAIALTKVRLLEMTKEDFQEICKVFPSVLEKGAETIKERAQDAVNKILKKK